ncbi:MAG: zinc dependent phospholipase C family protein [Gemmatimonadaceae bacterium]
MKVGVFAWRAAASARGSPPRLLSAAVAAGVLLLLFPATAHAWTPGTHVFLGEAVMQSLALLPGPIADLLRAFPYDFLYGSIAADTSIAKKYAPAGRHCHSWTVGLEIHERARSDSLRAFGLGYLSHLAADVVAHNYFVPRQLAVTSTTVALGHSYWESRFETHLGEGVARRARELIMLDHTNSDAHLDRILSPTIFSTQTNRRIFRGMVYVTDTESWQRIFQAASGMSRWDLADEDIGAYVERSYDLIIDMLNRLGDSAAFALDPAGENQLRLAKQVRRDAMRLGGVERITEYALEHFGMPGSKLGFAASRSDPIYVPVRSASN